MLCSYTLSVQDCKAITGLLYKENASVNVTVKETYIVDIFQNVNVFKMSN